MSGIYVRIQEEASLEYRKETSSYPNARREGYKLVANPANPAKPVLCHLVRM